MPGGKTRLSIVNTRLFYDMAGALFWTAGFVLELSRFAAKRPSGQLHGVVLFDEADLYLPAARSLISAEQLAETEILHLAAGPA